MIAGNIYDFLRRETTLVVQSAPPNPPQWLERCMNSVQGWAKARGYQYEFVADGLFDFVPLNLRKIHKLAQTDLARLLLLKDRIGYPQGVCWIDSDVLVWGPLELLNEAFAVCRELWWDGAEEFHRTNNVLVQVTRAGMRKLEVLLAETQRRAHGPLQRCSLGPDLLDELHAQAPFMRVQGVGMFGPHLLKALFRSDYSLLEQYTQRFGASHAANLCLSFEGDEKVMMAAIDALERRASR